MEDESQPIGVSTMPSVTVTIYETGHKVVATALLVLLSPVLLMLAALVRMESRGQALFTQQRLGAGRTAFTMYKLRTMRIDAEDTEHRSYVSGLLSGDVKDGGQPGLYKLSQDSRVTAVGKFLRRTSLDELPQLLNVIRGDMLLVGPRPPLAWEADLFPAWAAPRFAVKPGMTGLWQVSGRNGVDYLSALRLDVEYVTRRGLRLDLVILLRTLQVLLGRSVAR